MTNLLYVQVPEFVERICLRFHYVLSGFALHLSSHFGRSFSNHSYRYAFSNDRPNCFAIHMAIPGSLVNYAG